jgi:hypothetical protein
MMPDQIRQDLLAVWGHQTCQIRPTDWPGVLKRLLLPAHTPEREALRGGLAPAVTEAVATLTAAYADREPTDAARVIWRAFPKLDQEHCQMLADWLRARIPTSNLEDMHV